LFASWGPVVHRWRISVLIVAALAVAAGGVWGLGVFDRTSQGGYEAPESEAVRAQHIAEGAGGSQDGDFVVLYRVPHGRTIDDPALAGEINRTLDALPRRAVTGVTSYWRTPIPQLTNRDRTSGLAMIKLAGADASAKTKAYKEIRGQLDVRGARAEVAGDVPLQVSMEERSMRDLAMAEAVSMPIVLVLLVIIFGGVVASCLPVLVGGMAVFGALGLLHLISLFADVNVFAINVASLLGLGLAIDYGLFIVGRFREELAAGRDTGEAVRCTVASAGRTVAFSATLLIIALAGLMLFPQKFLTSLAYGGMSSVALAAIISLTVLPAMLGLLGSRVDGLAVPWRGNRPVSESGRGWRKLASGVMKRPLLTAIPIIVVLGVLAAPLLGVRFGAPDERTLPHGDQTRQAIESLRAEFPAMSGNGIQVVLRGSPDQAAVQRYLGEIDNVPGVDGVQPSGTNRDVVVFNATLRGDPYGDQANRAVEAIRVLAPPAGSDVLVGGWTAVNLDSLRAVAENAPWVAGLLIGATLLLMFLAFGSVLLPIKAAVLAAISLSATFGALTWIFVDGNAADLLGVTPAPMEVGIVILMSFIGVRIVDRLRGFLALAHGRSKSGRCVHCGGCANGPLPHRNVDQRGGVVADRGHGSFFVLGQHDDAVHGCWHDLRAGAGRDRGADGPGACGVEADGQRSVVGAATVDQPAACRGRTQRGRARQ
jgi:trehalose monomycolate/heme transporter